MTVTPTALWGPTPVPAAAAAIYTAPALTTVTITRGFLTNESGSAATITLWLVRSGGGRTNGNIILGAASAGLAISAGPADPYIVQPLAGLVLAPGDAIHALSGTSDVLNFVGSGWTQTP